MDPRTDTGPGSSLQYRASVTRLMGISVDLTMETRVGRGRRDTAVTVAHTAIRVMEEQARSMAQETREYEEGADRNLMGSRGRLAKATTTLHIPRSQEYIQIQ